MLAILLLLAFPVSGTVSVHKDECTTGWFDPNKEIAPGVSRDGQRTRNPAVKREEPVFRLLVRPGRTNTRAKPIEVTTKPGGGFAIELPAGIFCIVLEDKRRPPDPKNLPAGGDLSCLRKRQQACDAVVKISGPTQDVKVERNTKCEWFDHECFPKSHPPAMD